MRVGVPGDRSAQLKTAVDAALEAGDHVAAEVALGQLWRRHPGPANASFVLGRVARVEGRGPRTTARVALLRSCTVEPLVPILRAGAAVNGLDLHVDVGGYNTFAQELLDPQSPVYTTWQPDVVVLVAPTRDLAPDLWDGSAAVAPGGIAAATDRVAAELAAMVAEFRRRSRATLLLHALDVPATPALGIADGTGASGQVAGIREVNQRLAEVAAATPDVHLVDYDGVVAAAGRDRWYDERKMASVRMPFSTDSMVPLVESWLRYLHPITGRVAKAVICDLDNTLWGGVVGEDGLDGLQLGHDAAGLGYVRMQRALLDVQRRGVLLGICSKNNPADVDEVFDAHPGMVLRREHFAVTRVNWDDKASNLRSIAAELNIGLDSIVFLDDNPAECALIRSVLPAVTVIELDEPPAPGGNPIERNPLFERLALSSEDLRRTDMYRQQRERAEVSAAVGSLDDYLAALGTQVTVAPLRPSDLTRAAQLTQKTNQLNVTTRRRTEGEIQAIADDASGRVIVVSARDRFGDHGTIGLAIARADADRWQLDTFLLSCRVIGRGVETAVLAALSAQARRDGARAIDATFIPTAKNAPASELFADNGFRLVGEHDGATEWELGLEDGGVAVPPWIDLEVIADEVQSEGAVRGR